MTALRLLFGATALLALGACGGERARPVRIVLVTLDTLRADSFTSETMPLVRERASRGAVFDQFYAATSSTQPTHATLFTGLEPWRHGVTRNGTVLDGAHDTLAERLRASGFRTAGVVASFPLERRFGFDQGFEAYDDEFEHSQRRPDHPAQTWSGVPIGEDDFYSQANSISTKAIAALDAAEGEKQFFWFHYFDPHAPYGDSGAAPIAFNSVKEAAAARSPGFAALLAQARAGYDADVRHLDRALDRLLARLERDAGDWDTHILITADHGESFGEEGALAHGKHLIRSQVHVPTIVISPRVEPCVRADPAGSIDVAPTVLAWAGLARDPKLVGRDLATPPAHEPPPPLGMRRTFAKPFQDVRADGSVVAVHGPQFFLVRRGLLYIGNGEEVGGEDKAPDPELVAHVREVFGAFEAELTRGGGQEDLAPETQRALEALGYTR